jgi:hypothetical protein
MAIVSETYTLLEGTTAVIDPQFGIVPSDATPTHSAKGYANEASFIVARDTFNMLTFATTNGWEVPLPRFKVGTLILGGFMSISGALSDPLALITQNLPTCFVLSVTPPGTHSPTACTLTGLCVQTRDEDTLRALDTSGRGQTFRTSGAVTSAWIIA